MPKGIGLREARYSLKYGVYKSAIQMAVALTKMLMGLVFPLNLFPHTIQVLFFWLKKWFSFVTSQWNHTWFLIFCEDDVRVLWSDYTWQTISCKFSPVRDVYIFLSGNRLKSTLHPPTFTKNTTIYVNLASNAPKQSTAKIILFSTECLSTTHWNSICQDMHIVVLCSALFSLVLSAIPILSEFGLRFSWNQRAKKWWHHSRSAMFRH